MGNHVSRGATPLHFHICATLGRLLGRYIPEDMRAGSSTSAWYEEISAYQFGCPLHAGISTSVCYEEISAYQFGIGEQIDHQYSVRFLFCFASKESAASMFI